MSAENAGNVISKTSAAAKQTFFRLKIDCSGDQDPNAYSLNRELAEQLISIRPRMRSIQMGKCLVDVLKKIPANAVVKDVDVLFNPTYKVDVLKVLIAAYKQHFYKGLDEKYIKRDGMYFLPGQVNKYDAVRATCGFRNLQFSLFVSDEKTAIGWLYQQLDPQNGGEPQTYQDFSPKFMQELKAVDKREKMPELMVILEENFLKDDKGRWYIPDYTKSGDIAKLREKNLLKEFAEYQTTKGKLKVFRSEAIRAGFAKLWKDKDYAAIVEMAERLPEETIQEDSNLLMYYDISLSRAQLTPTQMRIDVE